MPFATAALSSCSIYALACLGQDALKQRAIWPLITAMTVGTACSARVNDARGIDIDPGQQKSTCRLRRQRGQRVELLASGHRGE